MFSLYKYLIVNSVFYHLGFWSGNFFLITPFHEHCLLLPFYSFVNSVCFPSWFFVRVSCSFYALVFASFCYFLGKVWKSIPRIARKEPEEQEAYDEIDMKGK